jgi:hypothetical protein
MLAPAGEAAAYGGSGEDPLEAAPGAVLARLRRRSAALERQLEARIVQVAALDAQLEEQQRLAREAAEDAVRAREEAKALRPKAAEYDALMNTLTMRALRLPRAWYGLVRARLARRPGI